MIDDLTALRLQLEWGADEALDHSPVDRFLRVERPRLPARPPGPAEPRVAEAPDPLAGVDTLDGWFVALDRFTACPLRATATHTVRPSGSPSGPVLLIGDAPGNDDDRSGQAFSGPAGATLDRVMGSAGLGRERVLLTTLVPWRPPGGRPASGSEIQACLPFVHRLIGIVRPRAVVLVGAGPVAALTGETATIRQLRGKFLPLAINNEQIFVQALPILPLAQWLRDGKTKQQVWSDLMLLHDCLEPG